MRNFLMLSTMVALAACSGGNRSTGSRASASGEISRACLIADRSSASPALCGCVQSVANVQLSSRDRSRVAEFMIEPERANETKISNSNADDAFWDRYRAFITSAGNQCG